MGKNQRHKKVLRTEKAKTKLKVTKTKFLPKGTNVTDVNFKIRQIVIPEQLRAHGAGELLTKRKLSFKDLLVRLNHHNVNTRFEGCEGLLELVQISSQDVVEQSLHLLLSNVCKLILDRERKVRQKSIKLISAVLEKVSDLKLSPFCDILISHTTCAMTHIDTSIQEDSLLVIDALLKHMPFVLIKTFNKVLSNFLTLISKLRSESNPGRTLTINLGSKITSTKWRIKVLSRLQGILGAVVEDHKKSVEKPSNKCVTVLTEDIGHTIPIYKGVRHSSISFIGHPFTSVNVENNVVQYVNVLVPLLHETWAEIVPLHNAKNTDEETTVIESDAASILTCVIGIFYLLHELVKESSDRKRHLLSKENQKFLNHILNQFPFNQKDSRKKKMKKEAAELLEISTDLKCIRENLLITYLFCSLYKNLPNNSYLKKANDVLDYLNKCLVNRNYVPCENIGTLVSSLRMIFFENLSPWSQKNLDIEKLLGNLLHFYEHTGADDDSKPEIFNLLIDVVHLTSLSRLPKYQLWLTSLPSLLCSSDISDKVVDTLSVLSRQNNKLFLDALLDQLPEILGYLPIINLDDSDLIPSLLKIVSMFSFIPKFGENDLDLIEECIFMNKETQLSRYLQQLLDERSSKELQRRQ